MRGFDAIKKQKGKCRKEGTRSPMKGERRVKQAEEVLKGDEKRG